MRKLVTLLLWLALALPALAAPVALEPVDEASKDPAFAAFRTSLLEAVHNHDVAGLLRLVGPDVNYTFGPSSGPGPAGFRKFWKLDRPDSELWGVLDTVLRMGGSFGEEGTLFSAPYVYSAWPSGYDEFTHGAILGPEVPLMAKPGASGKRLATLRYAIVRFVDREGRLVQGQRWLKVQVPGGAMGFVRDEEVRSPLDYRAVFARVEGAWKLTALVAGD